MVRVRYWDHYSDLDPTDKGFLVDCVGYYCGTIAAKHPMLKISMAEDLSCPWTYVVECLVEGINRLVERDRVRR